MSSPIDDLLLTLPAALRAQLPVLLVALLCGLFIAVYTRNRVLPVQVATGGTASTKSNGKVELKYTFEHNAISDVDTRLAARQVKVAKLLIHPIKSCRGISVQETPFTRSGLAYDRRWCIIDSAQRIITARATPKMVLITSKIIEDKENPENSRLEISFPVDSGCTSLSIPLCPSEELLSTWDRLEGLSVHSETEIDGVITRPSDTSLPSTLVSDTFSAYFNKPVHLAYKGPRLRPARPTLTNPTLSVGVDYHDGYPLLVASNESFEAVRAMIERWLDDQPDGKVGKDVLGHLKTLRMERFRPNIVFEGAGVPFAEDMWRGIAIHHGEGRSTEFALVSKCTRCLLPNVCPETGGRNLSVPSRPLRQFRTGLDPARLGDACFGCNAVPAHEGIVRVGDIVEVLEWADV